MVLVTNGRLITRDSEGKGYYEHGAVAYEGTKIVEVGEEAALRAKYPQAEASPAGADLRPADIRDFIVWFFPRSRKCQFWTKGPGKICSGFQLAKSGWYVTIILLLWKPTNGMGEK